MAETEPFIAVVVSRGRQTRLRADRPDVIATASMKRFQLGRNEQRRRDYAHGGPPMSKV
jgi:hypothetical protein